MPFRVLESRPWDIECDTADEALQAAAEIRRMKNAPAIREPIPRCAYIRPAPVSRYTARKRRIEGPLNNIAR